MLKINSRENGIYCIKCKINGFTYIGSTARLKTQIHQRGFYWRIYQHRYKLQKGNHHSRLLQRDFDRYGEDAFEVEIIEVCAAEKCIEREQYYLSLNGIGKKADSYNTCPIAGNTLGVKCSDETKAKISKSNKGKIKGILRSAETKAAISKSHKGRKKAPESVKKMADSKAKKYLVIDPFGNEHLIKNMRAFCRMIGLHQSAISRTAKNPKYRHYKGFIARELSSFELTEVEKARIEILNVRCDLVREFSVPIPKKWVFTHRKTGETVETFDYADFCASHGINRESMKKVVYGLRPQCSGWECRVEPVYQES